MYNSKKLKLKFTHLSSLSFCGLGLIAVRVRQIEKYPGLLVNGGTYTCMQDSTQ